MTFLKNDNTSLRKTSSLTIYLTTNFPLFDELPGTHTCFCKVFVSEIVYLNIIARLIL